MTSLAARAEVIKLARELAADPDDLEFLKEASAEDLRRFRQRMCHELDARHRPMFRKLAAASKLLPNTLTVKIAMRYFGPMLCGMVASELTAERAAALMNHIPVEFLADATQHVDPVAAESIIKGLDTEKMVPTMQELLRRKEYVTLARFLGSVTDEQLLSVVPLVKTGEDLLMTGFYAEVTDRFEVVVRDLPVEQIHAIVQAAVDRDAFAEALTLMQHLTEATRARVADAAAEMGPEVVTKMIESAHREDAWAELIPVAVSMSEENLRSTANLEVWDADAMTGVIRAAGERDLWPQLSAVLGLMDGERIKQLAGLDILTEPEIAAGMLRACHDAGTLPLVVRVAAEMSQEMLAHLKTEVDTLELGLKHDLLAAARESGDGASLVATLDG